MFIIPDIPETAEDIKMQFTPRDDSRKSTSVDTFLIWSENRKIKQFGTPLKYKTALPTIIYYVGSLT